MAIDLLPKKVPKVLVSLLRAGVHIHIFFLLLHRLEWYLPHICNSGSMAIMVLCAYSAVFFAKYVNSIGFANADWLSFL
jgi:hypothetical protein